MTTLSRRDINKLKAKRDVPGLIKALDHEDGAIRARAAAALRKMEDARASEALGAVLDDDFLDVRREATLGLGEKGDPRATEALIRLLETEPEDKVWYPAARLLSRMGDAQDALERVSKTTLSPNRSQFLRDLSLQAWKQEKAARVDTDPEVDRLREASDAEGLLRLERERPQHGHGVRDALRQLPDPSRAVDGLVALIAAGEDDYVAAKAPAYLDLWRDMGPPHSAFDMAHARGTAYADYVRFEFTAIEVFDKAGGAKAVEGLQRLASGSSDRDVREHAARRLAQAEGAQS